MMNSLCFQSSIGYLTLYEENGKITEIIFTKTNDVGNISDNLIQARTEIEEYLLGKRKTFDFDYLLQGTVFERSVLKAMKEIPYGEKRSYSSLAKASGNPKAARAVGTVCRKNKLPILFPCHRVIRNDGDIGNYAGGKQVKEYLLDLEKNSK